MSEVELFGDLPVWAGAVLAGFLSAAALAVGVLLAGRRRSRRRRLLAGVLYAGVALGLCLALLSPHAVATSSRRTPARVVVLVDRSKSMAEADLPDGKPRWTLAGRLLGQDAPIGDKLRERAALRVLGFDADARSLSIEELHAAPNGNCSDLVRALRAALESPGVGPLAGVVILSDGRVTRGPLVGMQSAGLLKAGVPFWVVGAGDPASAARPRLTIASFEVPESSVIGESVGAESTVRAQGFEGRSVEVRFLVDGKQLESRLVPAAGMSSRLPVRFRFQVRKQGVRRLEIVARVKGAKNVAEVRRSRYLVVKGRPLRALYAEGRLGWGYRAMAASLSSAPRSTVDLWSGFILAPEGSPESRMHLADRLAAQDVLVLGDVSANRLGRKDLASLARAVREDGLGLVFMVSPQAVSGYAGTPLEPLLPVKLKYTGHSVKSRQVSVPAGKERPPVLRLDRSGPEDHRLWSSLPKTTCGWKPGDLRKDARVLLRAGSDPLLVAWSAGQGRVAVMAWPDHWRWARAGKAGAEAHRRFFARLAMWVAGRDEAGSGRLTLSMTRYRLSAGEEVSLLAGLLQAPPDGVHVGLSAEINGPVGSGKPRKVKLAPVGRNRYRLAIRGEAPGQYRVKVRAATVTGKWAEGELFFSVEGSDLETENPAPDFATLRRLAEKSGGAFLGPSELNRLPGLVAGKLPKPKIRTRRAKMSMWDRWPVMAFVLTVACAAWLLLRREAQAPREETEA